MGHGMASSRSLTGGCLPVPELCEGCVWLIIWIKDLPWVIEQISIEASARHTLSCQRLLDCMVPD